MPAKDDDIGDLWGQVFNDIFHQFKTTVPIPYQVDNCRHDGDGVKQDLSIIVGHSEDVNEFHRGDGNEYGTEGEFGQEKERPRYSPEISNWFNVLSKGVL